MIAASMVILTYFIFQDSLYEVSEKTHAYDFAILFLPLVA